MMRVVPLLSASFAALLAALLAAGIARASGAEVPITQANHVFSQDSVALASGDWVVVRNDDGTPHDLSVIDDDGDPQDLGLQQPGKVLRIHFVNAGEFTVRCSLTPGMRMKVTVR